MPDAPPHVIRGGPGTPASLEVAVSHALLLRVARGELPRTLRFYRPEPTVAFGRLDALRPGYARAIAAARRHGFEPVLRAPGGHAAAYDEGTLGFDHVVPIASPLAGVSHLFADVAGALANALRELGVDARVGAVPGEYCPGAFTVNARGRVKLVGTAQRAIRGASLLGGFVTVEGAARLERVLTPVYDALALAWDPDTIGAVATEAPGTTVDAVEDAVLRALAAQAARPVPLDDQTLELARSLQPTHALGA